MRNRSDYIIYVAKEKYAIRYNLTFVTVFGRSEYVREINAF